MEHRRKALYTPRFGSQTDKILKNNGRRKLSKTLTKVSRESSRLATPSGTSPEVTSSYTRKQRTSYLLRFYGSGKANKDTTGALVTSDGGKSQPTQSKVTSPDYFEFPSEDAAADKKSQIKQEVLVTVERMMEENRVIRQRLLTLSQTRAGH